MQNCFCNEVFIFLFAEMVTGFQATRLTNLTASLLNLTLKILSEVFPILGVVFDYFLLICMSQQTKKCIIQRFSKIFH